MSEKILIAYATRYGSTHEVAGQIGTTLHENGAEVDVRPMHAIHSLEGYRLIVLGAPLYIGHWHEEAHRFLDEHQAALTQRPVAIFALGPLSTDEKEIQGSREQLDRELEKYAWLKPVAIEMFVGKYDPTGLSIPHKLLTILPASPLHGLPASDNRDWEAIRNWSRGLLVQVP